MLQDVHEDREQPIGLLSKELQTIRKEKNNKQQRQSPPTVIIP